MLIVFMEGVMWKRFSYVAGEATRRRAGVRLTVVLRRSRAIGFALLADRALAG